jgi:undecaprenyl-diphosphatase
METLQIIILGIVQGITEFLPVSSSAHLVLVPTFTQWADQGLAFDIAVHIGTLAAVMLYFRKETYRLLKGTLDAVLRKGTEDAWLFWMLVFATLPLIAVAPFAKDLIETIARNIQVIGITSIVFGILLWFADKQPHPAHTEIQKEMTYKKAFIIGLFQVFALIPGTSRSGITMTAGRFLGFNRIESSKFSMLMAMPVIAMIGMFSLISDFNGMDWQNNSSELLGGILCSFIAALLAIHGLMKLIEKISFTPFVIYRIGLGIFLLWVA